jgi:hypothetical protein
VTTTAPTVTVTVTEGKPGRFRRRPQTWRWKAAAGNGKTLAVSSEAYTNAGDAISAIWALFGPDVQTRMVNGDGTYYILRSADDRRW